MSDGCKHVCTITIPQGEYSIDSVRAAMSVVGYPYGLESFKDHFECLIFFGEGCADVEREVASILWHLERSLGAKGGTISAKLQSSSQWQAINKTAGDATNTKCCMYSCLKKLLCCLS